MNKKWIYFINAVYSLGMSIYQMIYDMPDAMSWMTLAWVSIIGLTVHDKLDKLK